MIHMKIALDGIVAFSREKTKILNCYNIGNVYSNKCIYEDNVGGISGHNLKR